MKILLFDTSARKKLFPITATRATCDVRIGIFTLREKWENLSALETVVLTEDYLQELYGPFTAGDFMLIDANVRPTSFLWERIVALENGVALQDEQGLVAGNITLNEAPAFGADLLQLFTSHLPVEQVTRLDMTSKMFQWNEEMIKEDFDYIKKSRFSMSSPESVYVSHASNIFIEEGAQLSYCHLNAGTGPIYIGKNARVMEGCLIRGPFALCEEAVLKMGTKIYGATTLGPHCVGGGEIKNSIMMGYSNKAHDGYLGDSVIGEWCNLGAGTSNSNLKNNAGEIKVWSYFDNDYIPVGTKCGLVMGDYSRSSINTSFNTGAVVGVCCNVFGEGLSPKIIPDFTWGSKGLTRYEFDKGLKDVMNWMKLKNIQIDEGRIKVLKHIFEHTSNEKIRV